eukprot:1155224-Pelagomonas_calceolata.AAC.5
MSMPLVQLHCFTTALAVAITMLMVVSCAATKHLTHPRLFSSQGIRRGLQNGARLPDGFLVPAFAVGCRSRVDWCDRASQVCVHAQTHTHQSHTFTGQTETQQQ